MRLLVAIEGFYIAIEFGQARSFLVATECFYVVTELARVGKISIAIELATTESFAAHDRVGRAKASAHDSVAPCCVAIEEVMCA